MRTSILGLAVCLFFAGCAATRPPPAVAVDVDHHGARQAVETYSLVVERMPGFLVAYARDELVAALAARGASEVAVGGDVEFRLGYEQMALTEDAPGVPPDDFGERVSTDERARFLARIVLVAKPAGAAAAERIGTLSRVHAVTIGAYMHERARAAIRGGFDQLLDGYLAP